MNAASGLIHRKAIAYFVTQHWTRCFGLKKKGPKKHGLSEKKDCLTNRVLKNTSENYKSRSVGITDFFSEF